MKVAKCCESKEPEQFELLSWEQMQAKEGIYVLAADYGRSPDRFIVLFGAGGPVLLVYSDQCLFHPGHMWENGEFIRTSETLCVGLKDAAGKWVE